MADFKVFNMNISFNTKGEIESIDLTGQVQAAVAESRIKNGMVHIFAPHATGVIVPTENEQGLLEDIRKFLETTVPRNRNYAHPSNAHSHLRSMLPPPDRTLPVIDNHAELGTSITHVRRNRRLPEETDGDSSSHGQAID